MKKLILILIVLFTIPAMAMAADQFGLEKIDFFDKAEKPAQTPQPQPAAAQEKPTEVLKIANEWTEPARDKAGNTTLYTPPSQVLKFIEDPNKETGEAYLQWNNNRLVKIAKAQAVLATLIEEKKPKPKKSMVSWHPGQNYVAFFLTKRCPACKKQEKIIRELYSARPDVFIETFVQNLGEDGQKDYNFPVKPDMGLSSTLALKVFPSALIYNKRGGKYLVMGYMDAEKLSKHLNGPPAPGGKQ